MHHGGQSWAKVMHLCRVPAGGRAPWKHFLKRTTLSRRLTNQIAWNSTRSRWLNLQLMQLLLLLQVVQRSRKLLTSSVDAGLKNLLKCRRNFVVVVVVVLYTTEWKTLKAIRGRGRSDPVNKPDKACLIIIVTVNIIEKKNWLQYTLSNKHVNIKEVQGPRNSIQKMKNGQQHSLE